MIFCTALSACGYDTSFADMNAQRSLVGVIQWCVAVSFDGVRRRVSARETPARLNWGTGVLVGNVVICTFQSLVWLLQ